MRQAKDKQGATLVCGLHQQREASSLPLGSCRDETLLRDEVHAALPKRIRLYQTCNHYPLVVDSPTGEKKKNDDG